MYRLTIDVTNQVVRAYRRSFEESRYYDVLAREMICSTGTKSDPTPIGVFTLPQAARYRWRYFTKFKVYAQYYTRIVGDILFHSILYKRQSETTMVTSSYHNLGKRASHGCVRLLPEDARWIYENCPPGTTCEVYQGAAEEGIRDRLKPIELKTWYPKEAKDPPSMRSPYAFYEGNIIYGEGDGDVNYPRDPGRESLSGIKGVFMLPE